MRYFIWAILLVSLVSVRATAQTSHDSWENLKQLQPGHKIKVVDMNFRAWSGKLVSVSDEAIVVRNDWKKQEFTVERPNVLRVTNLERSHRRRNALIGLAAGTVLGAALVANEEDLVPWGKAVISIGFFGAPGAVIGAIFPGPRPTLYRAQKPPPATPASNPPGMNAGE